MPHGILPVCTRIWLVTLLFSILILRSRARRPDEAELLKPDGDSKDDLGPSLLGAAKINMNETKWLKRHVNPAHYSLSPEVDKNSTVSPGAVALNPRKTKTIAVMVSVHMDGVLKATLPCNENHVDRIIVITTKADTATQAVCDGAGSKVSCHVTDAFYRGGDKFNKGRALNELQQQLHQDPNMRGQAVLFIDPDICLQEEIWAQVPVEPEDSVLYTVTRRCVYKTPQAAREGIPSGFDKGYRTMGFFQLYTVTPEAPFYPTNFGSAAQSDLVFGKSFNHIVRIRGYANHLGLTGHWSGNANYSSDEWSQVKIPSINQCPEASTDQDV